MVNFIKNNWFRLIITVCVIVFTAANVYYYMNFLPEQRNFNRAESKRYECKQDVESLFAQYNNAAAGLEQNEENQKVLMNYALNLGIIDETGAPIQKNVLIDKCIKGN